MLASKFRGCALGALAGDCLGERFEEFWTPVPLAKLKDLDRKVHQESKVIK